ncbi:Tat pathway signal protein [Streptomyces sp. NPDC005962]|uniref:Tat pathway signal protein n=1 Tax=Streptomyces sp. NPDC005962 TaxID=3154466 RepID=UPI0033DE3A14
MARTRNTLLAAVIKETGWPQTQAATHFVRVAAEHGADELLSVTRSHIAMWISGTRPEGRATHILCETLSRRLGRVVTPAQIGLAPVEAAEPTAARGWDVGRDTVAALVDLGDAYMDMNRRQALKSSAYSLAGATLPPDRWWDETLDRAQARRAVSRLTVTPAHVEGVRDAMRFYSRQDQRLGGRAGRDALIAYIRSDVASYMSASFPSEQIRREFMTAAAELVYLAAWTAFDSSEHALAQNTFDLALQLAAEADDAPLAGHILRAAAHQAVDLGHPARAMELATGSMSSRRYSLASPREKALLGVVHARALAADRQKTAALAALRCAEGDLGNADGTEDPARVFFFAEASLAHETACTLRDLGDLKGAEAEFKRSVRTRALPIAARTHAVTLGYLGDVQVRQGHLDLACTTWSTALDTMTGIQSGRARDTVVQMRRALSPVRNRGGSAAAELDARAREMLRSVG